MSTGRKLGWVTRVIPDRAFGFLRDAQGDEFFMHKSNCAPNGLFVELQENDVVSFAFKRDEKGLKAMAVRRATADEEQELAAVHVVEADDRRGNR